MGTPTSDDRVESINSSVYVHSVFSSSKRTPPFLSLGYRSSRLCSFSCGRSVHHDDHELCRQQLVVSQRRAGTISYTVSTTYPTTNSYCVLRSIAHHLLRALVNVTATSSVAVCYAFLRATHSPLLPTLVFAFDDDDRSTPPIDTLDGIDTAALRRQPTSSSLSLHRNY